MSLLEVLRGKANPSPEPAPTAPDPSDAGVSEPPESPMPEPLLDRLTDPQAAPSPELPPDDDLTDRLAELERRDREPTARETRIEAAQALAERGLPAALLAALPTESGEALRAALPGVEAAFRLALEDAVRARLAAAPPVRLRSDAPRDRALRDAMGLD